VYPSPAATTDDEGEDEKDGDSLEEELSEEEHSVDKEQHSDSSNNNDPDESHTTNSVHGSQADLSSEQSHIELREEVELEKNKKAPKVDLINNSSSIPSGSNDSKKKNKKHYFSSPSISNAGDDCASVQKKLETKIEIVPPTTAEKSVQSRINGGELEQALAEMRNKKMLTDIILNVNGKQLYAHKVVLAARSPVFAAMFAKSNMNELEHEDLCDLKVVKVLLDFCYTGDVSRVELYAPQLIQIANAVSRIELVES